MLANDSENSIQLQRHQESLNDFARAASETNRLGQRLHLACLLAGRGMGVKYTKVMRYRPTKGDLLVEAGIGWGDGVVGCATLGTDIASVAGRVLQARQAMRIDDLRDNPLFRYPPPLREHGIISTLNVPIVVEGVVWGVLAVDSEVQRHFSENEVVFLSAMANILGLALQGMVQDRRIKKIAARALRTAERQKTLMRELTHRTKNDFQMVIAILLIQMDKQQEAQVTNVFKHVIAQISAISVAYDQLFIQDDQTTLDVATYLEALCGNLRFRSEGIDIETHLETAELPHEWAVSLGLITNELVTNAIKHAFPEGKGTVRVEFTTERDGGRNCLIVTDNGIGMSAPRPGSSGLRLMQQLAQQIGGSIEQEAVEHGTKFCVSFLPRRKSAP